MPFTIEQIAYSSSELNISPDDSYILSYPEFIDYFVGLNTITFHNFIVGAHFVYGWMPKILRLRGTRQMMEEAVAILNHSKQGKLVTGNELSILQDTINNSLVGTSKLLHFIRPDIYAIWDRVVYRYINDAEPTTQMGEPENYLAYLENCKEIISDKSFESVRDLVNRKIGYEVTAYRAVELVMFYSARR